MAYEFKFPDVGEGIHEGEIVHWRVAVGEEIKEDQVLAEVETAKAIVEIPSPKSGTVLALPSKEGSVIHVGETLAVIGEKDEKWTPSAAAPKAGPGVVGEIPTDIGIMLPARKPEATAAAVQKLPAVGVGGAVFDGPVERVPLKGVRKAIAEHMSKSASSIPHVTHMDECDVTALVAAREKMKPEAEKRGIKLTYLAYIVKAAAETLKKHPALNASLDEKTQEIVYKKYYAIGIAVDTEDGLMVPVIKNADKKDFLEIAQEVATLAQKCRDRKITAAELSGGSFTITNIGSVGGIFATPIIPLGQTAILGVMRMQKKPVVIEEKIEVRPILSLALSFDHRVVDGAQAARFTNDLMAVLYSSDSFPK